MRCMQINFGERGIFDFKDFAFLFAKKWPNFSSDHGLYSSWGSKNRISSFMQVEGDVKCMQIIFGGCDHSSFGDFCLFCLP